MKGGACSFGCGATVRRFTDDTSRVVQLNDKPFRGDMADPAVRHRLWRYRSKWTGWITVPYLGQEVSKERLAFQRGGHIFTEHDCARTPRISKPIRMSVHSTRDTETHT